jgi:hypothetical protein
MGLGDPESGKTYSESRIQGSQMHQIPNPALPLTNLYAELFHIDGSVITNPRTGERTTW